MSIINYDFNLFYYFLPNMLIINNYLTYLSLLSFSFSEFDALVIPSTLREDLNTTEKICFLIVNLKKILYDAT